MGYTIRAVQELQNDSPIIYSIKVEFSPYTVYTYKYNLYGVYIYVYRRFIFHIRFWPTLLMLHQIWHVSRIK